MLGHHGDNHIKSRNESILVLLATRCMLIYVYMDAGFERRMYEKYFVQTTWFRRLSFSEQILEHLISGYGVLNLSIN
jgi:hypothetical protein